PTFFSHFDNVPSAMDSPIWGMTTSTRATESPQSHVCVRRRARRSDVTAHTGRMIEPATAPNTAYVNQLQGAPVSPSAAHFVSAPTNLAINTAIMPPPPKP